VLLDSPRFVFELLPTGKTMTAQCRGCGRETSQRGLTPEAGAPGGAYEPLWQCELCREITIAVPPVRRVVALALLGTFALVPFAVLAAASWFLRELVTNETGDDAAGIMVALLLAAAGSSYVLWRLLRAIRGLLSRDALVPVNYDSVRRRWIIEGRL
jgi:hypothetical protein